MDRSVIQQRSAETEEQIANGENQIAQAGFGMICGSRLLTAPRGVVSKFIGPRAPGAGPRGLLCPLPRPRLPPSRARSQATSKREPPEKSPRVALATAETVIRRVLSLGMDQLAVMIARSDQQ
jgi:hypothetical protein